MSVSKLVLSMVLVASMACAGAVHAGAPQVKGRSLGKYQQQAVARGFGAGVGAGVSYATGNPVAGSVAGYAAGNHASKKWTGKGMQNWNKPKHW